MDAVTIATDLREFEASNVQSPGLSRVIDVDLYADEMRIAFSDEGPDEPDHCRPHVTRKGERGSRVRIQA